MATFDGLKTGTPSEDVEVTWRGPDDNKQAYIGK